MIPRSNASQHIAEARGLTLIELLVAVTVLAIVLTLGVPSFKQTIDSTRATSSANQLLYFMQLARSEATKRAASVSLCPSSNQTSCNVTDWTQGWLLRAADNSVLRVEPALHSSVTLTPDATQDEITFTAVGTATASGGGTDRTPPRFSLSAGSQDRCICLLASGNARVTKGGCPCP